MEVILLRYYSENTKKLIEISIDDVNEYIENVNKEALADFIYGRFYYRYIRPFECSSGKYPRYYKNGFSIMANCCLLIETLETFYKGWENSQGRSEEAFSEFFKTDKRFLEFAQNNIATNFYKHIRCGILHQGETTGGWRITRDGKENLLDISEKRINATKFMERLTESISDYKRKLKDSEWDDKIWKNAIKKIKAIIKSSQN